LPVKRVSAITSPHPTTNDHQLFGPFIGGHRSSVVVIDDREFSMEKRDDVMNGCIEQAKAEGFSLRPPCCVAGTSSGHPFFLLLI
jgi:hypothetical protein